MPKDTWSTKPLYATIAALDGLVTVYRKRNKSGQARTDSLNAYADSLPVLKDCPFPVFDFRPDSVNLSVVINAPYSVMPSQWADYCTGTVKNLTEYYLSSGVTLYNR